MPAAREKKKSVRTSTITVKTSIPFRELAVRVRERLD
jgi:hypothetical protein